MAKTNNIAPRIYNLFPRIIGSIDKWDSHIKRIEEMEFDWIYLNPLNYTGFSGSLYSIKDFYKFNPIFAPENAEDPHSWEPFKEFMNKCHAENLKIMYDLVINHTSIDSPLIEEHPEWFTESWAVIHKKANSPVAFFPIEDEEEKPEINEDEYPEERFCLEKRILSPYAIDPADASRVTIWGDLAEINNEDSSDLNGLTNYWLRLIEFYLDLGIDGFRCDAAYQIPSDMWKLIISHAKSINPDVIFLAETLGCTLEQMDDTVSAGFHYINNSSKWWDYTAPWLLEQYRQYRKFAPSVGFPESHDTERVAATSNGRKDVQIFKYLFAGFFSAGVMMPIGYEYGFKKQLDSVDMTPDDWETPNFDITSDIKKINRFKISMDCLNEDGPIEQLFYSNQNILMIKKMSKDEKQQLLLIYNKNWNEKQYCEIEDLKTILDLNRTIYSIDLDRNAKILKNFKVNKELEPNEFLFYLEE